MPDTTKTLTYLIISECKPVDREARYDELLDESGPIMVAGLKFYPSRIIKELDETAYRCGVNDMEDAEEWVEIEGEYYEREDVETVIERAKDDLESELSDLERELEAESEAEDSDPERVTELDQKIKAKQQELQEVDTFLE